MNQQTTGDFGGRLAADVAAYRWREFVLGNELLRLDQVRGLEAPEATIFHCGRILEVLVQDAQHRLQHKPVKGVQNALAILEQFNLLPLTTRSWAHAIRRLANDARHIVRPLQWRDAELALLLLERWLRWFFCDYYFGLRLPGLTESDPELRLAQNPAARQLINYMDASNVDVALFWQELRDTTDGLLFHTPVLPAVLAELLLERKQPAAAAEVLERGLATFPSDLRLRQLRGLHLSRTGQWQQAVRYLDGLGGSQDPDPETVGIKAGALKRMWDAAPTNQKLLQRCHEIYAEGWKTSEQTNAYLGINAATTALWLKKTFRAKTIAGDVLTLAKQRLRVIYLLPPEQSPLAYWDRVTLAEALLLLERWEEARAEYRSAFQDFAHLEENINVSRKQAIKILRHFGRDADAASFP